MLIDKMKLAIKEDLTNGQLVFWKPGSATEDIGIVLDNDWKSVCYIFWFRQPEMAGQPDQYKHEWFDQNEGSLFVLRGTDDQDR